MSDEHAQESARKRAVQIRKHLHQIAYQEQQIERKKESIAQREGWLAERTQQAREADDHLTLGYTTWDEYVRAEHRRPDAGTPPGFRNP
jgi:hypothetical protein